MQIHWLTFSEAFRTGYWWLLRWRVKDPTALFRKCVAKDSSIFSDMPVLNNEYVLCV